MHKLPRLFNSLKIYQFCTVNELSGAKFSKQEWEQKEKDWKAISIKKNQEQLDYVTSTMSEFQKKHVELLVQTCGDLDLYELQCFFTQLNEHSLKSMGVGLVDLNSQWPALKQTEFQSWPPQSSEELDKAMKNLWEGNSLADFQQLFGGSGGGSGMGGGTSASTKQPQAAQVEVKEVKPTEKLNYDIELQAFDPAKKILVIKEVRQLFNLGLKEAKDLVEKAPCTLQKQTKQVDAKSIKEKLEALGCSVNLL